MYELLLPPDGHGDPIMLNVLNYIDRYLGLPYENVWSGAGGIARAVGGPMAGLLQRYVGLYLVKLCIALDPEIYGISRKSYRLER